MGKLLAVIKREYVQRVRSKMFIVITVLGPIMLAVFTVVPGLLLSKKIGGPTRLAIVDQTGRLSDRVRDTILRDRDETPKSSQASPVESINANMNDRAKQMSELAKQTYQIEQVKLDGRPQEEIQRELNMRIAREELDGYIVLPKDILKDGNAEFYGRNAGDVFTRGELRNRLSQAVAEQRMADENISEARVFELSKPVEMIAKPINAKGEVEWLDKSKMKKLPPLYLCASYPSFLSCELSSRSSSNSFSNSYASSSSENPSSSMFCKSCTS